MSRSVLVLTATIHVGNCTYVARTDCTIRQNDYLQAVTKFLENTPYNIVWCENSGADTSFLSDLKNSYGDRFEIISYTGNDGANRFGKGYCERITLREALSRSKYADQDVMWVKVTGRLYVSNIQQIIETTVDTNPSCAVFTNPVQDGWCRCEVAIFNKMFFHTYFWDEVIDDQIVSYFEHALGRAMLRYHHDHPDLSVVSIPTPQLVGVSGTSNVAY
jgi:hypothetical protein